MTRAAAVDPNVLDTGDQTMPVDVVVSKSLRVYFSTPAAEGVTVEGVVNRTVVVPPLIQSRLIARVVPTEEARTVVIFEGMSQDFLYRVLGRPHQYIAV